MNLEKEFPLVCWLRALTGRARMRERFRVFAALCVVPSFSVGAQASNPFRPLWKGSAFTIPTTTLPQSAKKQKSSR
jgi:hypothetical protein